jgi:RHS repeat-associated protein
MSNPIRHLPRHMQRAVTRLAGATALLLAASVAPTFAQTGETIEYYGIDAIGSVRVVFDPAGALIGRIDFTPFGEELAGASATPKERFAGLFRDGEAGLDYAQARMYQARTGRFITIDPKRSSLEPQHNNRFGYALNNPLFFVDTAGLEPQKKASNCTTTTKNEGFEIKCPQGPVTPWIVAGPFSAPPLPSGKGKSGSRGGGDQGKVGTPVIQKGQPRVEPVSDPITTTQDPTDTGFTIIAGVGGSLVGLTGAEASTGIMVGSNGCPGGGIAGGGFGSMGMGVGVNVSADAFVGAIRGPVRNVRGVTGNVNLVFGGVVNVTVMLGENGIVGGTIGFGVGAPSPVLASTTVSGTGIAAIGDCR